MSDPKCQARIRWRCHRGMLELDMLLLPFCDNNFPQLNITQQATFERLLEATDPELFAWLMGHEQTQDPEFVKMIKLIQTANNDANRT